MSTFMDGPAVGVGLSLRRAPLFLRVVQGPRGWDALDQLDDAPAPDEIVHVYRRAGGATVAFVCGRRGQGGRYAMGHYRYMPDVDGERLRGAQAWREWCREQVERDQRARAAIDPLEGA